MNESRHTYERCANKVEEAIKCYDTATATQHSRRRSDLKSDLQNLRFSRPLFWVTGTPVYSREKLFENFGTPVKTFVERYGDFCQDLLKFWWSQFFYIRSPSCVVWMRHFTHVNDHTCKWPISATHVNGSYHTYEGVMSHKSKMSGQGGGGNQVLHKSHGTRMR